jgi:type IV pilus biogenesis protein PilP
VGLSRRSVSLIGVFGAEKDRYAMVRLPNGRMQRVRPGDQVQGARVAAIGQNSVQLTSSGRTTTLGMPN